MRNIIQRKKPFRLLLILLLFPFTAFAQSISVSGTIADQNGEALTGVSVVETGTTKGTVSDIDGKYQISVSPNAKLTFTYISYKTVTLDVKGRKVINVTMNEDTQTLDEIVVVGYGTMKRRDLTGSVASVNSDAVAKSVPVSVDQILQGRAAGVQVQQTSGMPGASSSVRIRGISSINASNEPIYVIDGVVIEGGSSTQNSANTNPLATINPSDIVSMDVLKDASATAIYGSRAANGVILITTKRGQKGEANINYNGYMGWQEIPQKMDVLDLQQYAAHRNTLSDLSVAMPNNSFVRPDLLGPGTDWQGELFNRAMMQSHNLSITGGNEKTTYMLGAGYLDQEGIAAGSGFERINLSGNFDSQVKSYFKTGINFAFTNMNQNLTVSDQSLISLALRTTPDVPVRNADGTFAASEEQFMPSNPMAMASLIDNTKNVAGVRSNVYAELTLMKDLVYKTDFSFDYNLVSTKRFQPTYLLSKNQFNDVNQDEESKQLNEYWSWRNVLTYNKTFGVHVINAMLGQEMQRSSWNYLYGSRTGFLSNNATDLILGDQKTATNNGYTGTNSLISFFGRMFYSYKDRYLLTATLRRDGSSKFAEKNRWGWFPSTALAWRVSEEDFLKDHEIINNLKLRLGWGEVGNQNIPDNAYFAVYGPGTTNWGTGLRPSNTANPALVWETTNSSNLGLDLSIFNNRIEFVADVYYRKTDNLLMIASLTAITGTSGTGASEAPWVNAGSLENKGFELSLNTTNIQNKDFLWRTNLIFSLNRNKVLEVNSATGKITREVANPASGSTTINSTVVGQPIGQFSGYQIIGRFEKATDFYYKDAEGNIKPVAVMSGLTIDEQSGVWIGDYIYKDLNKDGVIDTKDIDFIGNPEPKFTYGIGNTFTYKGIDLSVFLTGSYGNDVVNYQRRWSENPMNNSSNLYDKAIRYARLGLIDPNGPNDYRNVQIVGGDADMCRMPLSTAASNYDFAFSDRYVEDGSYLRIQNISLGYTFPRQWTNKIHIQTAKLYVNLQNVYTFTKYTGYDPEVGISYSNGVQLNGIDYGRYPSPRVYTFGLNLTF